jgi:2,4-dienoyl-CoA reductase-like NADH-dependent reductase (Old Yellow Enzyme family)/thioredoxin reductase
MSEYNNLFKPLRVGKLLLRNRIVAAPITKYGYLPSPADELETIAAKARGGAGLVILGSCAVDDKESLIYFEASSLHGHKLPLYNEEISMIHQYGAKVSIQLLHCGMWADCRGTDANPVGPYTFERSGGDFRGHKGIENNQIMDGRTVIGIDEAKMEQICEDYARAAIQAKRLGFDMVMLHFAHGWLPAEFLSPYFNLRTDAYGGSFENRIRFPMMIVDRVRKAVGPDFPIDMRIGAEEYIEGGLSAQDVVNFIKRIEDKIDMVHVSSGLDKFLGATTYIESPSLYPHLINVKFAERVKQEVKIPVCTVGGITLPEEADKIITEGKVDAIAMGRGFIADPDWPNKARTGRAKDIIPCIRCVSCYSVATEGISQGCAVNPRYGRELRLSVETKQIEKVKNVIVVGGGTAGMKAAVAASERGYKVTLFEKEKELGGLIRISDHDPIKQDMYNYKTYLIHQVLTSDIDLKLNCEATPETVKALNPDELIIAVGSVPVKPRIPGIDLKQVMDVVQAHEKEKELKQKVAIIGAGPSGCELALSLADKGHEVTLIESSDQIAGAGNIIYRGAIDVLFKKATNLNCLTETTCMEIVPEGIKVRDQAGEEHLINVDNIVYSVGMRPLRELAEAFYDIVYDVKMIGDCMSPRRINEATHEGYFAGLML